MGCERRLGYLVHSLDNFAMTPSTKTDLKYIIKCIIIEEVSKSMEHKKKGKKIKMMVLT